MLTQHIDPESDSHYLPGSDLSMYGGDNIRSETWPYFIRNDIKRYRGKDGSNLMIVVLGLG